MWRRGLPYILQWKDNLAENVVLDLYQGGSFVQSIATNSPTITALTWNIKVTLVPGSDYSISVRSATNSALIATSGTFSIIDQPQIRPAPITWLSSTQPQQFQFSAPGAASATVWGSTNLGVLNWQSLGAVKVAGGNAVFTVMPPYNFYRISVP